MELNSKNKNKIRRICPNFYLLCYVIFADGCVVILSAVVLFNLYFPSSDGTTAIGNLNEALRNTCDWCCKNSSDKTKVLFIGSPQVLHQLNTERKSSLVSSPKILSFTLISHLLIMIILPLKTVANCSHKLVHPHRIKTTYEFLYFQQALLLFNSLLAEALFLVFADTTVMWTRIANLLESRDFFISKGKKDRQSFLRQLWFMVYGLWTRLHSQQT